MFCCTQATFPLELYATILQEEGDDTYEIDIGTSNNTRTVIRAGARGQGEALVGVSTPDIVDCNEYRVFWMSWANGTIVVCPNKIC